MFPQPLVIPLFSLSLLLALACSAGGGGGPPMTVEEYAAVVCADEEAEGSGAEGLAALEEVFDQTWGEARAEAQAGLDRYEGANPPDSLQEYHDAKIAGSQAFLDATKDMPAADGWNPFLLMAEADLVAATSKIEKVEKNLPNAERAALEAAGCHPES